MTYFQFLVKYYPLVFLWISAITVVAVYRNSWPLSYKILAIFILFYTLSDTIGGIMASFYKMNNHFIYNFLYSVQFLVISHFYYHRLNSRLLKKAIIISVFTYLLLDIISAIWLYRADTLHTYNYVLGGFVVVILSLAYLLQIYARAESNNIFHDPVFWFSLAWLLFFSLTVPFLGMINYLNTNYPVLALDYYVLVVDITDCLRSILLTIGFLHTKSAKRLC
jgi:hypothetical protein